MPTITLPATVAPNELIQSAWGNSVVSALDELADESAGLGINTFTGNQLVDQAIIRVGADSGGTQFAALDTAAGNTAYVGFFGSATDINTPGTRTGLVGLVADNDVRLWAETGGNVELRSESGVVAFQTGGATERARINSTALLVNKTSSSIATAGVELLAAGRVNATLAADDTNLVLNRVSSAIVSAGVYINFASAGSAIGSVTRNAATSAVLYNTSSDARYKTDVGLEDSDGLATVEALPVRRYLRDGAESASVGMFAQDVHAVIPQAVTPGDDENIWQMAYGDENIVGHLLLAVQQLSAKVRELEGSAA